MGEGQGKVGRPHQEKRCGTNSIQQGATNWEGCARSTPQDSPSLPILEKCSFALSWTCAELSLGEAVGKDGLKGRKAYRVSLLFLRAKVFATGGGEGKPFGKLKTDSGDLQAKEKQGWGHLEKCLHFYWTECFIGCTLLRQYI